ncbi:MAG: Ig-like domain-containing protein, partial [Planctomycetota bacterium]
NVEFINDGTADGTVFVSYSAKQKRVRVFGALSITNFILRDVISIKSVSGGVAWDSDRNIIELNALSGELLDGRFKGTGAVFLVKDDAVPPPLISVSSHSNGDVVRAGETISGWAYASNGIRSVEYRVNGGDWRSADGTADWRLSIEPTTDSPSLVLAVRATSAETGQTLLSETRVRLTVSDEINNQVNQVRRPAVIPPPDVRIRTMSRDQIRFILNGIADNISVAHLNDAYGSASLDVNGRLFGPVALRTNRSGLAELLADVRIAGFKYGRYDVDSMDVRATYRRGDASLALTADTISIYGGSGQAAILFDLDRNGKITAFRDGRLTVKELSLTAMSERLDWKTRIGGLMDLNLNSISGILSEKKALRGWGDFKTYKGELYKLDLLKQGAIFISGFNSSTLSQATGDLFLYGDEIRLMSASVKSRDGETEMFMDSDVGPPAAFDYDGDIRQAFLLNWRTPPRKYEAIPGVGWVYKIRRFTSALGRLRVSGSFENPDITNWSFQIFRSSDTLLENYKRKLDEERRTADESARIVRRLLLLPPDGSSIETDFSAPPDALSGRRTLTKDPTEPEIGD